MRKRPAWISILLFFIIAVAVLILSLYAAYIFFPQATGQLLPIPINSLTRLLPGLGSVAQNEAPVQKVTKRDQTAVIEHYTITGRIVEAPSINGDYVWTKMIIDKDPKARSVPVRLGRTKDMRSVFVYPGVFSGKPIREEYWGKDDMSSKITVGMPIQYEQLFFPKSPLTDQQRLVQVTLENIKQDIWTIPEGFFLFPNYINILQ